MKFWCARVAFFATAVIAIRCESPKDKSEALEEQLRMLSKQVTALLERREEDLKSIEDSIRREIFESSEVFNLRNEVKNLRSQLDELPPKSFTKSPRKLQNEEVTIKWLSDVIGELKLEIADLQDSLNSSRVLQNKAGTDSEIHLMKSDIANLNQELEISRKKNEKYEAELLLLREEIESVKDGWKHTAAACGDVQNQFKTIQNEWNENKLLIKGTRPSDLNEVLLHPSRHQKILKNHILRLETNTKRLQKQNNKFDAKLRHLEEEIRNLTKANNTQENIQEFDRINGNDIQNYIESNKIFDLEGSKQQISKQIADIIRQQSINTEMIFNLTKEISDLDKLHLSTLELLENVETLETKVDHSFPEFRKEVSAIEVHINEIASDILALKEDQTNTKKSVKAISFTVSTLQDKSNNDHDVLSNLQQHLQVLEKSTSTQASSLHNHILKAESSTADLNATKSTIHMVEELRSFENEYKSIVNKLPRDCGNVDGPSGIYLISPGDGEPILAYCDNKWTTFQKRYDGSINFNRNWKEYSNGFGSVTGEHWLGNRHLHLLTKDNCTKLQINMKDIYGKYWQANYDEFRVLDFTQGFRLVINKYSGNSSDAFNYQNNMEFSTVDNDRDLSNTHCASNYEGGWWFSHCQHANLNGRFNLGLTWFDSSRNEWIAVAQSEMRLKRKDVC